MQLGFVIDHSRCIGCHACTVACKSENDVPLGDFRTWVKYTESGDFPEVRRSFAVLRCNQCSEPPCVEICPVSALEKHGTGIVDIDPKACIGCKACMHGCPYDALYINPDKGIAEKCHFCAHRTEVGLAPACAVVCPTEAIIPGDFDDPTSRVSRLKTEGSLAARKVEAGTGPNVFYKEANRAGLDPGLTNTSSGYLWAQNPSGPIADAQAFEAAQRHAEGLAAQARTTYDVPRNLLWGWKITGYLWAKSIAAGALPAAAFAHLIAHAGDGNGNALHGLPSLISMLALAVTGALLVADLKRPERFWYILVRPNWNSWLARGTYVIVVYSGLLVLGMARWLFGDGHNPVLTWVLVGPSIILGGLTAAYTGFLFTQAKGRVLWMKRGLWAHLAVQALVAGSATCLLLGFSGAFLLTMFLVSLGAHTAFTLAESRLAPAGREAEYHRAARLVSHGPYAMQHWYFGLVVGVALPTLLLFVPYLAPVAALLALVGLAVEEDITVRAGQALPIS